MTESQNMIGRRFGQLVVIELAGNTSDGRKTWLCRCDCGKTSIKLGKYLRCGDTKSCGCIKGRHQPYIKHGLTRKGQIHYLYWTWQTMHRRCRDPNHQDYKNYGARGITVCERWDDFAAFVADMGERPHEHTLERIDNNLGYFQANCEWATRSDQARNRRQNTRDPMTGRFLARSILG